MTEKYVEHENTEYEKASVNVIIPDQVTFTRKG